MCKPFDTKLFRHQFRYIYLFIPLILYFIILLFYPKIEAAIYGTLNLQCYTKNAVIWIDQYIFSWLYDEINFSFNKPILILFAIPYLIHFINPIIYLSYLAYKRSGYNYFWKYVLSFGLTCSLSIIIQSSYPTAPPWYYLAYPNEAKFYLVDNLFNFKVFNSLYGLNKLICGAFPSLHVGWPTVIAMNGVVHPIFGICYVFVISSAAVYSRHHWIIDAVFGLLIGVGMSFLSEIIVDWLRIPEQRETMFVQERGEYRIQEKCQIDLR